MSGANAVGPAVPRPLGVFGGTFDPVHLGQLRVAWEAAELLDAEVRLVPANVPPHRPAPLASAAERVAMLRVALRGQDRLMLDTREIERSGPSYTVDTLAELRAELGQRALVLLVGADMFAQLPAWDRWRELFELAHVGVLSRPGVGTPLPAALEHELQARRLADLGALAQLPAGRIVQLEVTPLEISATRIRALLAAGRDPRYLLPAGLFQDPELLRAYRA
jgi:nicotinate-nucleotide adenylyltransferase